MPELIPVVIIAALMFVAGYAGYKAGRDKATREAYYTVSTLRESLTRTRLEVARLEEAHKRLIRGQHPAPVVEVPKWMQP